MNLRAPGSAPFHLRVKFHAFPGLELLPPGKSEIVTGDGVYEETWISPQQWRREITLGSYHAVETNNDRARKMQASSDHEPSRVIMLMEALLNPIARYALSPESLARPLHWKTDHSSVAGHSFVRISASSDVSSHMTRGTAYVFLPGGLLLQSNVNDIVTTWQDDAMFSGKVVPRRITIQAGAVRDLLTAEAAVGNPEKPDPAAFDLPGLSADPGMTLRPLTGYADRLPMLIKAAGAISQQETYPDMIMHGIVDRHGSLREVEVIYMQEIAGSGTLDNPQHLTDLARQYRFRPAEIDGNPCESTYEVFQTRH